MNWYAYVHDDPMDHQDPTGNCPNTSTDSAPLCVNYNVSPPTDEQKKINTIVTDGKGNVKPQLNDPSVPNVAPQVVESWKVHENKHAQDFNENACPCSKAKVAAAPAGDVVASDTHIEVVKAEVRAYTTEINYDKNILKSTKMDPMDRQNVIDNMNQSIEILNQYQKQLSDLQSSQ